MVATVLLVLGAVTGMFLHGYLDREPLPEEFAVSVDSRQVAAVENYILHVASGDPQRMKLALQEAKALLSSSGDGVQRKVEVVANEQGLDLLRSDVTQFKEEISYLASEKVIFYACSKTIQRLEEKGIVVKLVPEAIPGYTALDRVVLRMNEGWQYIKI
jgi:intracellular sulfur oxidation DsrE/DsrF family protein